MSINSTRIQFYVKIVEGDKNPAFHHLFLNDALLKFSIFPHNNFGFLYIQHCTVCRFSLNNIFQCCVKVIMRVITSVFCILLHFYWTLIEYSITLSLSLLSTSDFISSGIYSNSRHLPSLISSSTSLSIFDHLWFLCCSL